MVYNVNYNIYQYVLIKFGVNGAGFVSKKISYTTAVVGHFAAKSEGLIESHHSGTHWLEFFTFIFIFYETIKLF